MARSPFNADEAREAWRRYVSTGAVARRLLRRSTYHAWARCHDLGASPHLLKAEALSVSDTERLLAEQREFIAAATPFMAALSRAASSDRHAAMLGDGRGVVLDVVGDEASVRGPEAVPGPGCLLAEETAGANGIGSPLAEQGYVEFVGPEHFIGGFHPFTCQGVPIHDPQGRTVGVISTSVRRPAASQRLRDILVCAANGIEAELLRLRLERDVERVLASGSGSSLAKLRDDVVQTYAAARVRLEAAARRGPAASEYTLALVREAQRTIERFRHRAALWRDLASDELGMRQPFRLDQRVVEIVDLLATDAATRRVALVASMLEEARVVADARAASREIFGAIVSALENAGEGGSVEIAIRLARRERRAVVSVSASPAPGVAPAGPLAAQLAYEAAP
ncbi:sigma-54-dependent transcriptional regulator family protein [Anaeromyxobacter terrae]|uniref:hypothetical protein n=1 Tax=Anaeromyxobacter terrae TaxID=2925406 RepID=UPI001F59B122|nr:hypothetical protein [Anaeromyxobacter sp. SG22]